MANALDFAQELQNMKPTEVIRNDKVRARFIEVYNNIWKEGGEACYEREAIYFNQQMRDKAGLRTCTSFSIYNAFIDLAVRGLTLAPGAQALCYLIARKVKVGVDKNGGDIEERLCNLTISGYGELFLRAQAGQIKYADNPVIVYEGDEFRYGERDGKKIVEYMAAFPRKSSKIVACYVKIYRLDGTVDYSVMTQDDWQRLSGYSLKQNSHWNKDTHRSEGKANALYTSNGGQIDPGFLAAKCVKHAFKSYGKLRIGKGSVFESEMDNEPQNEYYAGAPADQEPAPQKPETFAEPQDMSGGIVHDTDEQNEDDVF